MSAISGSRVVERVSCTYDEMEFVAGAMIAAAPGLRRHGRVNRSSGLEFGDMPRRKVRTPQGAMVGNAHRPVPQCVARIGTVPQKIDRLGRGACRHDRGKGETAR